MSSRAFLLLLICALLTACAEPARELPTRFVFDEQAEPFPEADSPPEAVLTLPETARIAGLLDFWEPTQARLSPEEPDVWRFIAEAGDTVTIRVIGLRALLTLQDKDGQVLGLGDRLEAELPQAGTYTVIVSAGEDQRGGEYEIGLGYADRPHPDDITPTLLPEVVGVPTPVPVYAGLGVFISRLTNEGTVGGTLDRPGVNHVYTFNGQAGDYVQIEMNRVSGEVDPLVTLYDPGGLPIATDNRSGEQGARLHNVRLLEDGLYSVQAGSLDGSGGYSIRLLQYDRLSPLTPTRVELPTATPIPTLAVPTIAPAVLGARLEVFTPVQGTISQAGAVSIHSLQAVMGDVLTIGVARTEDSALLPEIEISDPQGIIIAAEQSTTAGSDALVVQLRADLPGAYNVFVRGEAGTTGDFIIGYGIGSAWRDAVAGPAEFDRRNEGEIDRRGVREVWTLELRQGDIITATVNPGPGSALDPLLELAPASDPGLILAIDDNSGGGRSPLIRRVEIPETGLYLLRVRASQAASTGSYNLIWRYINVAATPTVPPAVAPVLIRRDTIPEQEYRFYPFYGRAGQRVRVRVLAEEGSGFDPVAALIGPDGEVLIEVDDTEGDLNPRFNFELPDDGTYNVRVNGYLSGGPFEVIVEELF
jgi:hypothetical protein